MMRAGLHLKNQVISSRNIVISKAKLQQHPIFWLILLKTFENLLLFGGGPPRLLIFTPKTPKYSQDKYFSLEFQSWHYLEKVAW